MALRKSTRVEDHRLIHVWADSEIGFRAEVRKDDGWWKVNTSTNMQATIQRYDRAVDVVMDEWRLAKAGHSSWDEPASQMAEDDGKVWADLSDDEQHDYIEAARADARMGA